MNYSPYQKYGITQEQFNQIKEYFMMFNPNQSGQVNPNDIKKVLEGMGQQFKNQTVYQQICTLCSQGRGSISFEEFVPLMTSKILKHQPTSYAHELIQLIDDQKRGYITFQTLSRAMQQLKIEASDQVIQKMLKYADKDKDLMINKQQLQDLLYSIMESKK